MHIHQSHPHPHAPAVPTLVGVKGRDDQRRVEAEQFIQRGFARAYGADVQHYLPLLMGLRDADDQLLAVLGMRHAVTPLFLEHYLSRPVEQALAAASAGPVMRSRITEVGNLVVATPGGGRWLITALTAYLHGIGQQWVVFTCGATLRNAFGRMGVELLDLGEADATRLPAAETGHWGRYYAQRPRVMAGNVERGYQAITRSLDAEHELQQIWQGAAQAARRAA